VAGQSLDLLQGTLDVLVLRTLLWGEMHGYAVSRWIHDRTDGVIEIEDAALYYHLTRRGRQQLRVGESTWRRYAEAVAKVLEPA